jgi:hydrophobic/amphiphilic exporter-1 (mainly G- bacteria), HAE1 family
MTTFALVPGMMPIALGRGEGSQFRAPLGVAVIGGVIASTLLTLLVIPTFYEIMDDAREWMFGLFRGGKPAGGATHARERERPLHAAAMERDLQPAD